MFDISLFEFFIAAVVALLILGPDRLPVAMRTMGLWIGRLRRSYFQVKTEIEREIGMDEVRRQLHNESIMEQMKEIERDVGGAIKDAKVSPSEERPPQPAHGTEGPRTSGHEPREARDGG